MKTEKQIKERLAELELMLTQAKEVDAYDLIKIYNVPISVLKWVLKSN